MEDSKFDVLLRKVAQQTTRREALGALLGGALLLNVPDASEATNEAEHRQHHKQAVVSEASGSTLKTRPAPSR